MSRSVRVTCDGCQTTLRSTERAVEAQVSVQPQLSSIDPEPSSPRDTYRFRSVGWDLCADCGKVAYDLLVGRFGVSGHDSLGELWESVA